MAALIPALAERMASVERAAGEALFGSMVDPGSANSLARRRSSSRLVTAWRMTNDIRDSPSSSGLRCTRRSSCERRSALTGSVAAASSAGAQDASRVMPTPTRAAFTSTSGSTINRVTVSTK